MARALYRALAFLLLALAGLQAASLHAAGLHASSRHGDGYRLLFLDGHKLKWGEPHFGEAATATYGFAARAHTFEDAINCGRLAPVGALLQRAAIERDALDAALSRALANWSSAAGVEFRKAAPGETPDILIGAQGDAKGIAFANVWYDARSAQDGLAPLTRALICLNPEATFTLGEDAPGPAGHDVYDLEIVLGHEIGHVIGLDHTGATGQLMGYSYQPGIAGLMPGDVAGARHLYGPPLQRRPR